MNFDLSKIIIFGNTGFSKMMYKYIELFSEDKVVAFTVDSQYINETQIYNCPVVPFENIISNFNPEKYKVLLTLGYNNMNQLRQSKRQKLIDMGYKLCGFVHPSATVCTDIIEEDNIILENVYIGYGCKIGNSNIFWNGCNISHNVSIGNYNYFSPSFVSAGFSKIGNNCFLGSGSILKDNIILSDYTLLGAGCYLNHNTKPYDVFVPAKSVKLPYKSTDIKI